MGRNPRTTKQWQFLNHSDYKSSLSPEDRAWLDDFDAGYWKDCRSSSDAMDRAELTGDPLTALAKAIAAPRAEMSVRDITIVISKLELDSSVRGTARRFSLSRMAVARRSEKFRDFMDEISIESFLGLIPQDVSREVMQSYLKEVLKKAI